MNTLKKTLSFTLGTQDSSNYSVKHQEVILNCLLCSWQWYVDRNTKSKKQILVAIININCYHFFDMTGFHVQGKYIFLIWWPDFLMNQYKTKFRRNKINPFIMVINERKKQFLLWTRLPFYTFPVKLNHFGTDNSLI